VRYLGINEAKNWLGDLYKSAYFDEENDQTNDQWLKDDLKEVEAMIHSAFSRAYHIPITKGQESLLLIKGIVKDIIKSKAHLRKSCDNEQATKALDNARNLLMKYKAGKLDLPDTPFKKNNISSFSIVGSEKPQMKRDQLAGF